MPYGWEDIKKITVEKIIIGEEIFSDAPIHIFSNDSKLGPDFFLLGMGCFKNTVIVLDFENNLLWIKKPTESPVNSESNS